MVRVASLSGLRVTEAGTPTTATVTDTPTPSLLSLSGKIVINSQSEFNQ